MRVIFSDRAYAAVLAETTEKITTETGGLFLGVLQDDAWYIIEAIDPGPKSVFEVAYFEYDQKYTQHLINKIANLYQHKLDLIGLWHRHPGSFDQFSSTDNGTNAKYAAMRPEGAISALVNIDPLFRITMYHVAQPCHYNTLSYAVGNDLIPAELLAFKTPEQYFDLMERRMNPAVGRSARSAGKRAVSLEAFMRFIAPYLVEEACDYEESPIVMVDAAAPEKLAGAVIDDLTFLVESAGIQVTAAMADQALVISQEIAGKTVSLRFVDAPAKKQILFAYDGQYYLYRSGMLEAAARKAKAEKEKQAVETAPAPQSRRSGGVFDSVRRFMKFNKSEDTTDGN